MSLIYVADSENKRDIEITIKTRIIDGEFNQVLKMRDAGTQERTLLQAYRFAGVARDECYYD